MNEENLYPNDSSYFLPREPEDQSVDRKKERANTLEVIGELRKMVDRLQQRIEFYEKTTNIPEDVRTDPQQFLIVHNSYTLTAQTLRSEKEYLEGLIGNTKR